MPEPSTKPIAVEATPGSIAWRAAPKANPIPILAGLLSISALATALLMAVLLLQWTQNPADLAVDSFSIVVVGMLMRLAQFLALCGIAGFLWNVRAAIFSRLSIGGLVLCLFVLISTWFM